MVLGAILLASCDGFFTNSLGEKWARDTSTIEVSAKNVKNLLKESRGDTKASKGILDKIAEELQKSGPNSTLQVAAITAANQASGLGELVLENIGTVLENDVGDNAFDGLLGDIQEKAAANEIKDIGKKVEESLGPAVTTGNKPEFKDDLVKDVPDAELAQLALVLVLAESEKSGGTFKDYITTWEGKDLDGTDLTDSERIIGAIANEFVDNRPGSDLGSMISELLKSN
jgi:hypothetical protein